MSRPKREVNSGILYKRLGGLMNLLIGIVIVMCLVGSELQTAQPATDLWMRLIVVALISLAVPGLALFQTLVVSHRIRNSERSGGDESQLLNRISICHSAVWLAASLAIISAVRWQDVVRGNWELDRWPLLDELFILAPVVFSLVASWAIFYEIQSALDGPSTGRTRRRAWLINLRSRMDYISIRFRVYFLMVLIPISIAVVARDLAPWLSSMPIANQGLVYLITGMCLIAGFPFLILGIWKTGPIEDAELRRELDRLFERTDLRIGCTRIWNTGGRIANALVAGLFPWFRVILLSDRLIERFPRHELMAVLRHEAGHLKLFHLPIRIGFFVLPLLALTIDEQNPWGLQQFLESQLRQLGLPAGAALGLVGGSYLIYLWLVIPWVSRKIEMEADIYACQPEGGHLAEIDSELARDMSDALLRLGALAPSQFARRTLLYPSIRERIAMIQSVEVSPQRAVEFRRAFARRRRVALGGLGLLCGLAFLLAM